MVSYGGVTSEVHSGKNLGYILPQYHFTALYGLSALVPASKPSAIGYKFHFQLAPDYTLTPDTHSSLEYAEVSYIIIGKATRQLCKDQPVCQQTQQIYLHREQCVTACPASTKPVTHLEGGIECQDCPVNAVYDSQKDECACKPGFSQGTKGECIPVAQNSQAIFSMLPKADALGNCLKLVEVQ